MRRNVQLMGRSAVKNSIRGAHHINLNAVAEQTWDAGLQTTTALIHPSDISEWTVLFSSLPGKLTLHDLVPNRCTTSSWRHKIPNKSFSVPMDFWPV